MLRFVSYAGMKTPTINLRPFRYLLAFVLLTACSKNNSSTSTPGISVRMNGKYLTFNKGAYAQILSTNIFMTGSCDSPAYQYTGLVIRLNAPGGKAVPGVYPHGPLAGSSSLQSGLALYPGFIPGTNFASLPESTDDTVIVSSFNDSTLIGTFHGTISMLLNDPSSPTGTRDSLMVFTNGKFNLRLVP